MGYQSGKRPMKSNPTVSFKDEWTGLWTQFLWVLVSAMCIDIWPCHISHIGSILINYLPLSPGDPVYFELIQTPSLSSSPFLTPVSPPNLLLLLGYHHLDVTLDLGVILILLLFPPSTTHLLICPLLSSLSLASFRPPIALNSNYHDSFLSGLPAPLLAYIQLEPCIWIIQREFSKMKIWSCYYSD